jgi:hypothetical protein
VKVPRRVLRPEKSAAGEAEQKKQSPQAADLEKSGALEPDQRKPNHLVAVQSFNENLLLGQLVNLHLKQKIRVRGRRKRHKRGLTGSQKDAKRIHLLPMTDPENGDNEYSFHRPQ